jgi:hypothetical protein
MNLDAAEGSDERGNILVAGKLAEREHNARVGRLVIFDDELNLSAKHATRFVHFFSSELCALSLVATRFNIGSGERSHHTDFERFRATRKTDEHCHHTG